jgi:acyl-CoA thioesterase I
LHKPGIVILELGANDGLRGLPIAAIRANLDKMIRTIQAAGVRPLLVGMRLPPNYGPRYTADFYRMYGDLAHQELVPLVPFLLEAVALKPGLMQPDGLHPNARAASLVLNTVWPRLSPLLRKH